MKRFMLWLGVLVCLSLMVGITVDAADPWLRVRFAQILVDLRVDRNATVTGDLALGDDLTVAGDSAITGSGTVGGTFDVTGAATFASAVDLAGNVSSSSGVVTVTDNVMIDGAANAIQLKVHGYTTQTADIAVVETSAGTDLFTVDVTNTTSLQQVFIDGSADEIQLLAQGYVTQTTPVLTAETSTGTDLLTVDITRTTVAGALRLESVDFSGPIRFGSASTVVTGTTIAHGLGITPTAAMVCAGSPVTTPVFIVATDATSITVGVNDSVSVDTVYWFAGK